jgi:hypothetical protein
MASSVIPGVPKRGDEDSFDGDPQIGILHESCKNHRVPETFDHEPW